MKEREDWMEDCSLQDLLTLSQKERLLSAVAQRTSVRTYLAPPDVAQRSALQFSAARLRTEGVRFEILEGNEEQLYRSLPFVDTIVGSGYYAAVIVDQKKPRALSYAGACGEALALEAVALGLGTCWVTGTFRKRAVQAELSADEKIAAVIAMGEPAKEKHKHKARKKLTDICTTDPTGWPLWAYEAAECVRMAPSAFNRQPWRLSYSGHTMQLEKTAMGGGLDMGIAMLHMLLGVKTRESVLRFGEGRLIATLYSEDGNDTV